MTRPRDNITSTTTDSSPSDVLGDTLDVDSARRMEAAEAVDLPQIAHTTYTIEGEVARGGIGRILRARDLRLNRMVALKELIKPSPVIKARFAREMRITARLQHPAIVPVYEAGVWHDTGEPFFAMRLVSGQPLSNVILRCESAKERLALVPHLLTAAEAMAYAHRHRVLHRDLKPSNILVGEFGEIVVIDWGLAKDLSDPRGDAVEMPRDAGSTGANATLLGSVMGTPRYMPPEQARGEAVDERADVYALGAILYHILAGDPPYPAAQSPDEILEAIATRGPTPVEKLNPLIPPDLAAIVHKAMARDKAARYPDAAAFVEELGRFLTGQLVGAYSYTRWELARRWIRKNRAPLAVAAVMLGALATTGVVSVRGIVREKRAAQDNANMAQKSAEQSRRSLMRLYEEEGRLALFAGDFMRGLLYVGEAYVHGDRTPSVRFLLARATRSAQAQRLTLEPHNGRVGTVEYSPDGRLIATAGEDATVRVWDAQSGKLKWMAHDHADFVPCARFSPDGKKLLTAGHDGAVYLYDAQKGQVLSSLGVPGGRIWSCELSADGRRILASDVDNSLARTWDTTTGTPGVTLSHKHVFNARFSPDGTRAVTCGEDPVSRVWDVTTGKRIAELKGHTARVNRCAFSPDGVHVATAASDDTARLWDARNGAQVHIFTGHTAALWNVAFSPDGARLLTSAEDGTSKLWTTATGRLEHSLAGGGPAWVHGGARFSPDGRRVATMDENTVRLWDTRSGKMVGSFAGHADSVSVVAFSPDGQSLVSGSFDRTARTWDVALDDVRLSLRGATAVTAAGFSPDGARLAVGRVGLPVTISALPSGKPLFTLPPADAVALGFSADGHRLLVGVPGGAEVWDLDRKELKISVGGGDGKLWWAELGGKGRYLVTAHDSGLVQLWNGETGRFLRSVKHDGPAFGAGFSPDGERLVTAGADKVARIWDTATGTLQLTLTGHQAAVHSASFSPDGTRVLTSSADKTARVWDARTGQVITALTGHALELSAAAFSADGARIVTTSFDGTVRVWDAADGRPLAVLDRHTKAVNGASFSPDGRTLVSAGEDGFAHVWDVHLDERTPDEVSSFLSCRVPFQLKDGKILPAMPDLGACATITRRP